MTVLVGREATLGTLLDLVDRMGAATPRVVTVIAPAGMGKSALLTAFRELVSGRDAGLLTARPLEVERHLAFATLGQLLADLGTERYDDLPPPQRAALRAALLLDDTDAADPRAVAAGVGGVLARLAAERPLVLLVDDAQWLDAASASALALGLRRLGGLPVLVVAAARPTSRPATGWLPDWPVTEVALPPLPMSAVFHVVREHLGVVLNRGQLRAVHRAAEGNPLHALEFARHRVGGADAGFEALLTERVLALPRPTRHALLATALCSSPPTVATLAAALEECVDEVLDALEPAVVDRLVRAGDTVRFRHPLYLEAVVDAAPPEERRALHRRLADVEPLAEARVRHLAEAATGTDRGLADRLDASARRLWGRAAWAAAVDLLRLAVDHTPRADALRTERMLLLAGWLITNGSPGDAEDLLRDVRTAATDDTYWEATIQLAELAWLLGRREDASPLVKELLAAELPIELRARMLFRLDAHLLSAGESVDRAGTLAATAEVNAALRTLPDRPGLARLRAEGLSFEAGLRWAASEDGSALLAEAVELDAREPALRVHDSPQIGRGWQLIGECRWEEGRAHAADLQRRALEAGDDLSLPEILLQWGCLETAAGSWRDADELFDAAQRVAEAMRQEPYLVLTRTLRTGLAGLRGDPQAALADLDEMWLRVDALGYALYAAVWWQQVGEIRLAHDEHPAAYDAMVAADRAWRRASSTDPVHMRDASLVEAAVAAGRLDEAAGHLADARGRVASSRRDAVAAELGRARVALLAARGETEEALAAAPAMLAAFDAPHRPLERAKALLLAGRLYRRHRAKKLAHETLTAALEGFERIGCPARAARARAELARVGLRQRTPDGLTDNELHVARLAARGLRNTEIAVAAFVSVKTVESTLSRCYQKLGIRSRTELSRALDALPVLDGAR